MNIAILETAADENPLDALTRAALNGMGKGSHDGTAISCFVITPASLRPYVEEHVLRALHELRSSDPESYAGMTLPVHSFASFAASVIGNADGGAYVRTPMGAFALQTFVRHCMHENPALFGGVPDTHGFVALVARQLSELVSDGIAAESLQADADASGSVRMASMATLMRLYAERYAQSSAVPNDPAAVIVPWAERHAQDCRWYLYGFDDMTGSQLRAVRAVMARGHVTVCVESGRRFVCLAPLADDGDGAVRLPSSGKAPTGQAWSAAFANVVDETRWVRDRVAEDIAEGVPPRDVLVCARDLSPYERLLPNIFGESSIAINGMAEATLADDAFAGTLLGLLDPALYAFETKAVIRVFRSGAFSLGNGGGGRMRSANCATISPPTIWIAKRGCPTILCPIAGQAWRMR